MGLLDGLFSDDPQKQALMAAAFGLLTPQGGKNFGANLGYAGQQGLLAYAGAKNQQAKLAEEAQQAQLRNYAIQQAQRGMDTQNRIDALAPRYMYSGQPLTPNDDNGNPMPSAPPSMDWHGYTNALTGIDPTRGLALRSQLAAMTAKNLQKVGPGETLYNVDAGKAEYQAPVENKIGPNGQVYNPQQIQPGQNLGALSYHDMGGYVSVRDAMGKEVSRQPKTMTPGESASNAKPQIVTGPQGDILAVNPATAKGTIVKNEAGEPLTKGQKTLTESQAKGSLYLGMMDDAEKAITSSKFDPTTLKNQTLIAFAKGDIPKVPQSVQNLAAGKDAQKYTQATLQWSEAMLRQLTGSAAPDSEVRRNAATYFPVPGDSQEVIAQKNQARKQMTDYIRIISGQGAAQVDEARAARKKESDPLNIR